MKKLLLPFAIVMAMFLTGCQKVSLVKVNGICQGYVRDYYSNTPLSGVMVSYKIGDKSDSVTSDTSGSYVIKGLPAGSTRLVFSKNGYESYTTDTWIEPPSSPASVKGGGSVDIYDQEFIHLPQLSGGFSGIVFKSVGPTGEIRPAAGFEILLTVDNAYTPSFFSTTTDAKGAFSLSNLPVGIYTSIAVKPQSDADNYYFTSSSITLYPNVNSEWYPTIYRTDKGIYLVSTSLDIGNGIYSQSYPPSDDIVLTFSQPVSLNNTKTFGYISLTGYSLNLDTDVTISGSTVTIIPPTPMAPTTSYTLKFDVYSQSPGDDVAKTIDFVTSN